MNRRKEILEELKETAPALSELDNQAPFHVPAGYFDTLPGMIMLRIRAENAVTAKEELEIISPLLGNLNKKMPFGTPAGYFETLTPKIPGVNSGGSPARVVKMFQPRRTFRYAAAAAMIGIIGIAAWLFMRNPTEGRYAVKSDTEVQKELEKKVNEISDKELANFIEATPFIPNFENGNAIDISEEDVKLMLADIPDQDLENYLDQNTVKEKFN